MAWTTPRTWSNEVVTAAKWNVDVRDNLRALKDPPSQNYEPNEGANYSGSGSTSANVDTDFNFSITTTGGDILVSFIGNAVGSNNSPPGPFVGFNVTVDGTSIISASGYLAVFTSGGLAPALVMFTRRITGIAAGAHNINLKWNHSNAIGSMTMYAGAGSLNYDVHGQFWARELT
jgi:hypothetical protein